MAEAVHTRSIKEEVLELVQRLPDDCTLDEIQYHLYVRQMVAQGLKDIEDGKVVPHDEVKRRMQEWLKSRGLKGQ